MVIRVLTFLAVIATLAASSAQAQLALSAKAMYDDALAKERAVRMAFDNDLEPSALLKAMRTVVRNYETVVRRYPTSGYSDDALWNGGQLAYEAFKRFKDAADRTSAIRLLRALTSEYPSSKFGRQVAELLPSIEAAVPSQVAAQPPPGPARPDPVRSAASTPAPSVPPAAATPSPPPAGRAAAPTAGAARMATLKAIRREVFPESVRVTIELDGEVSYYEDRLSNPDRVFVDLPSTTVGAALKEGTVRFDGDADDPVRQVRLGRQKNRTTRVVLETEGIATYSVYSLYEPFRLVVDCVRLRPASLPGIPAKVAAVLAPLSSSSVAKPWSSLVAPAAPRATANLAAVRRLQPQAGSTPTPRPGPPVELRPEPRIELRLEPRVEPQIDASTLPATVVPIAPAVSPPPIVPPSRNLAGGLSMARQLGLSVSRIVIDPGHGGHDPGARARNVNEAELVLDVALRLEKLLKEVPGVEVILTRRTDVFVPLEERTAIANREAADLFLSIHANASNNTQASGVETYFLNFASNLSAAAVAARENAASGKSMGALPDFVKAIALNNKLDESRDFATHVQRSMIARLRPAHKTAKDLGVKQAPFVVLIGAAMPSVLSEIAFVTNAQEAKLLRGSAYRQRIAEALFGGVRNYQGALKPVGKVAVMP